MLDTGGFINKVTPWIALAMTTDCAWRRRLACGDEHGISQGDAWPTAKFCLDLSTGRNAMTTASAKVHTHVEEQGSSAPSLIFLRYRGGSSRAWRDVIGALPGAHRTLAVDLRGCGASDAPRKSYALADIEDDVLGRTGSRRQRIEAGDRVARPHSPRSCTCPAEPDICRCLNPHAT